jgi:hypothetical protein
MFSRLLDKRKGAVIAAPEDGKVPLLMIRVDLYF